MNKLRIVSLLAFAALSNLGLSGCVALKVFSQAEAPVEGRANTLAVSQDFQVQRTSASSEFSPTSLSTWADKRYQHVKPQQLDMSCGPSSLSALLVNYTDLKWTEADIIARLIHVVPEERGDEVIREGFSLLDMKNALRLEGYSLRAAFDVDTNILDRINSPAIIHLKFDQGNHFVLWHGRHSSYHWVSDPSQGDMWLSDAELFKHWTRIAAWVVTPENDWVMASNSAELENKFLKR